MIAKLQKVTVSFIVSVSLAIGLLTWKNVSPTEWIFMKFLSSKFKFH